MFFNAVKATILISATNLAVEGLTFPRTSDNTGVAKRHYGCTPCDIPSLCQSHPAIPLEDGYATAKPTHSQSGESGASSGGIDVMVQGWASLNAAINHLQVTFSSGASVDVAVKAALSVKAQVQLVSTRYGSCGCSASPETRAAFQKMAIQFFTSIQLALQSCQQHYVDTWETRFQPIFHGYSPAFKSLQDISASLQADLKVTLQHAHVNVELFADVGLNLSALLKLNLSVGGIGNL